jgi:hypothetical protein
MAILAADGDARAFGRRRKRRDQGRRRADHQVDVASHPGASAQDSFELPNGRPQAVHLPIARDERTPARHLRFPLLGPLCRNPASA